MIKFVQLQTTSDAAANYVLIVILKVSFKKCYPGTSLNPGQSLHTNQNDSAGLKCIPSSKPELRLQLQQFKWFFMFS